MKKFFALGLSLLLLLIPTRVFAAGYINPSTSSLTIQQGSSTTFSITAFNAIGDVSISSSNTAVATVSASSWSTGMVGDGETKSGTITVTGVGVGSAQIILNVDGATFDNESVSGKKVINVTVNPKPTPSPQPSSKPTQPSNPKPPAPSTPADTRSNNSNLSKLTINKKEVSKTDGIYLLEVSNYIYSVDIGAVCEDSKASASGIGKKDLVVGDNNFDVVVTAENGKTSVYKVVVKRSEFNLLNDLDGLLKLDGANEIRLGNNDKLDKNIINKIIDSKKKVILNKYDDKDIKLYSWILDGSVINGVDEFNPIIPSVIDDNEKVEEDFNYADGIYLDLRKCGVIPKGIILKYNVANKYKDNDSVILYSYNDKNGKIKELNKDVVIKDGFVEIKLDSSFKHFLSKSKLSKEVINNSGDTGWMATSIILFGIIVIFVIVIVLNKVIRKRELN